MDLAERIARVELLVLDVGGVLTDGTLLYTDSGEEAKRFHVRDGSGLKLWLAAGKQCGVISGRSSVAVHRRAAELGLGPVLQGRADKAAALDELLAATGRTADVACAVGDDLADLALFHRVGVRIAVADACPEVQAAADFVTITQGGRGAVREAVEWLLKAQGHWEALVARFRPAG
jgi:3-deoxy-D-manno-octulosonate 8-phosphate phosphatase (KDO 8-P phosphatase)